MASRRRNPIVNPSDESNSEAVAQGTGWEETLNEYPVGNDETPVEQEGSETPNEVPNTETVERSTGVRGVLSKEGFEKLERYEAVTGLSRSDLIDLAVKTLDTVDVDYLMVLIRNLNDSKVSTIERMLRSR